MTDRAPFSLTMTFPRSYNASAARGAGIVCRTCADDVLAWQVRSENPYGNSVRAYDIEKDAVRHRARAKGR